MSLLDPNSTNRPLSQPLDLEPKIDSKNSHTIDPERFPFGVSKSKSVGRAFSDFFSNIFKNLGRKIASAAAGFFGFKSLLSTIKAHIRKSDLPPVNEQELYHNDVARQAAQSVSEKQNKERNVKTGELENVANRDGTQNDNQEEALANESTLPSDWPIGSDKNDDLIKELKVQLERRGSEELDLTIAHDKEEGSSEVHSQDEASEDLQENTRAEDENISENISDSVAKTPISASPNSEIQNDPTQTLEVKHADTQSDEIPVKQESVPLQQTQLETPLLDESQILKKHNELVSAYIEIYERIVSAKDIIEELRNNKEALDVIKSSLTSEEYIYFETLSKLFNDQLSVMAGIEKISKQKKDGEVISYDDIDIAAKSVLDLVNKNLGYKGLFSHLIGMQEKITLATNKLNARTKKIMIITSNGNPVSLSDFIMTRFIVLPQRVAQLPVTLREVIKNTPQNHSSEKTIGDAFSKAQEVAMIVNSGGKWEGLYVPKKDKKENDERLLVIKSQMPTFAEFCRLNGVAELTDNPTKVGRLQEQWRENYKALAEIIDFSETPGAQDDSILKVCSEYVDLNPRSVAESIQWYSLALNLPPNGVHKIKNVIDILQKESARGKLSENAQKKLFVFKNLIDTRDGLLNRKL